MEESTRGFDIDCSYIKIYYGQLHELLNTKPLASEKKNTHTHTMNDLQHSSSAFFFTSFLSIHRYDLKLWS